MMTHKRDTTQMTVEKFKESTEPKVLVSPSLVTGWDFPYDECRWQIIAKIPFPDGRSEVMQARQRIDPDYGMYLAVQSLVQACGRGMRAPDDFSEVYVIDNHWEWFVSKYKGMFQNWFLQAVKRVTLIPGDPRSQYDKA